MKFLIFGGPGIGDTIIELSLAKALKQEFPGSTVDLIVSDSLQTYRTILQILDCQDYIRKCWTYSRQHLWKAVELLLLLRREKYDYGFSCPTAFKATALPSKICRLIGCRSVIKQVGDQTGRIDYPVKIDENFHIVRQYEKLLTVLHSERKLEILVLNPQKITQSVEIRRHGKELIVICVGTNITICNNTRKKKIIKNIKDWGNQNWVDLASVLSEHGYDVALIGGKDQKSIENLLCNSTATHQIMNYVGKTSIKESLSILGQADLVVGADTGFMHCAAALNKKTLSLFGGTDPEVWRPYSDKAAIIWNHIQCAPCYGTNNAIQCKRRNCMDSISVNLVYSQILNCLR
jgi:lipopolysaccharide heptosyltransferase II